MHDRTLMWIALAVSAVGLIALTGLLSLDEELVGITAVEAMEDGNTVRLRASVRDVRYRGNVTTFTLAHEARIDGVIFSPVNLSERDCVLVSGTRDTYDDRPQLVVKRLVRC